MTHHIVLGVTGSIAAYKAVEITSSLVKQGHRVTVIMTETAQRFINPVTFRSISHNQVITDLFVDNESYNP
ncbi:MAG: flavoprotein, partial [Planctomycetota bacterium]